MSALVLAIPSKGRLKDQTEAWLHRCGLALALRGGERGYSASLSGAPQVDVRLASVSDITAALLAGEVHFGVTGEDVLRENARDFDAQVGLIAPLGFGRADLVVAAPARWADVTTMADLAEVAAEYRARQGRRLRVATKYVRSAARFFAAHGVADHRVVESLGATEGAPAAGVAEVIVDITTTGATLAANGLKILADGLILKSQAQLVASRGAAWGEPALRAASGLLAAVASGAEAGAAGEAHAAMRAELLRLAAPA
jgi:ATP phosphoribosyltransferase